MRAVLALGLWALVAAGCRPAEDPLITYRLLAMATWVDIRVPRSAAVHEPALIGTIEAELREFEKDYYAWGDGELAALNRALSESGRFDVSEPMARLLETASAVARASDGAFEPGVGALVELWGFHGDAAPTAPPADADITARLADSGSIRDLVIDGTHVEVGHSAVADGSSFTLDLGGIAKGAAVDRIVSILEAHGIAPALVNAGGDLRVLGMPADRDWRIGIAAPRDDGLLGTLRLEDREAAFTSGDYERFFERDGERFHHILDPGTGYPVMHTRAVTVIADNGTLADAAATALFVAGPDAWRRTAAALGIEYALRVDATGTIEMTSSMRERLDVGPEVSSDIIATAD